MGRSLHGERGLKLASPEPKDLVRRRSLHGERGLKPNETEALKIRGKSLPSRGAWIETALGSQFRDELRSLPSRGAWIET